MDRSNKAHVEQSTDTCTLYSFPEISCSAVKETGNEKPEGHFLGQTAGGSSGFTMPGDDSKENEANDEKIAAAYNEGVAQGRSEMMAAHREAIEQATSAFQTAIAELVRLRQRDVAEMETETVRLAMAITRKIVGVKAVEGAAIQHVVKAAMEKVGDPSNLTLKLNPADISTVENLKQVLLAGDDPDAVCRIEPDETIDRGGCLIETQLGDVDARIDQQIQLIEESLSGLLQDASGKG